MMKKLWDYIRAHNLQDPQDKRTIHADDKLRPVLGADRVGMFKLAGIVSGHLLVNACGVCTTVQGTEPAEICRVFWLDVF
ncbi:MAG: SWIB/MDM2 domain-containing protein [Brachymonas sp.]|nr:SWIB/MDM2 domain-containing protein [Brachymonas sp.]